MSGPNWRYIAAAKALPPDKQRQSQFNEACANAIKWSYRIQGLTAKGLEKRINGVKTATWGAYGQQSYNKNRTMHVLAMFSWASQVCIKNLFRGSNIEEFYGQGENRTVVECMVYAGKLSTAQFEKLIHALLIKAQSELDGITFSGLKHKAEMLLTELENYQSDEFLMPEEIDVEVFKDDFYRSVSQVFKEWRESVGASKSLMAAMLGESIEKYCDYENPYKVVAIPASSIMRLIIDFKADKAAPIQFSKYMETYTGLKYLPKVQNLRKKVILLVTTSFEEKTQNQTADFVKSFVRFY